MGMTFKAPSESLLLFYFPLSLSWTLSFKPSVSLSLSCNMPTGFWGQWRSSPSSSFKGLATASRRLRLPLKCLVIIYYILMSPECHPGLHSGPEPGQGLWRSSWNCNHSTTTISRWEAAVRYEWEKQNVKSEMASLLSQWRLLRFNFREFVGTQQWHKGNTRWKH